MAPFSVLQQYPLSTLRQTPAHGKPGRLAS
jgi:hypothetical protein